MDQSTPTNKRKNEPDDNHTPRAAKRHQSEQPYPRTRSSTARENIEHSDTMQPISAAETPNEKPESHGPPPVCSNTRGALADALPYHQCHEGGLYTQDLVAKSILINGQCEIRDIVLGEVLITSVGGGRTLDTETGKMVRVKDQEESGRAVKAFTQAVQTQNPLVVIVGSNNKIFPVQLHHHFNVMDYFFATDIWREKVDYGKGNIVNCYKIRLEKVDRSTRSWWVPKNATPQEAGEFKSGEYNCKLKACQVCSVSSKEMFKQGWMCMNTDCSEFFQNGSLDCNELQYSDAFLNERTNHTGPEPQYPLVPPLPENEGNAFGTEKRFKRGIVCPKCSLCSRRIKWEGWYCENNQCDFKHKVVMNEIPLTNINQETGKARTRSALTYSRYGVKAYAKSIGGNELTTWFMPGEEAGTFIGSVTRIRPPVEARIRGGGLDDLYVKMQNEDIGLRRGAARNSGSRIEELTSHFSVNFGAPYKFGVVVKTTSGFMDAPDPIIESVLRLTWAGKTACDITNQLIEKDAILTPENAIPKDIKPYNEQLILGYFENSKISPHDDGEKEVGPNVATLSLGSPAQMRFHPKKNTNLGNPQDKSKRHRQPMLGFLLEHGDTLVMHGSQIQKLYIHAVDPYGMHRFALTSRYILPETIKDATQRSLVDVNGKIPDKWAVQDYDGETDQFKRRPGSDVAQPGMPIPSGASISSDESNSPSEPSWSNDNNGTRADSITESEPPSSSDQDGHTEDRNRAVYTQPQPGQITEMDMDSFMNNIKNAKRILAKHPDLIKLFSVPKIAESKDFATDLFRSCFLAQPH
ncbi:hypothetical protein GGS23DRAFT_612775 [Durotheca rogersii]|uniref:uncharacterized protein n=1 Tax=Durotheca rogersii TaxID=419775 RepID=UPI00221F185A|nr:uncharacterized protein GGS23DRAFT_612775 [Durotheca rogersii]KAI5867639.1 hypothetical protein GGS23DRAFT_612775 [Durotheca rogersii]